MGSLFQFENFEIFVCQLGRWMVGEYGCEPLAQWHESSSRFYGVPLHAERPAYCTTHYKGLNYDILSDVFHVFVADMRQKYSINFCHAWSGSDKNITWQGHKFPHNINIYTIIILHACFRYECISLLQIKYVLRIWYINHNSLAHYPFVLLWKFWHLYITQKKFVAASIKCI